MKFRTNKVLHPGGFKATKKLLSMLNIDEQTSILVLSYTSGV